MVLFKARADRKVGTARTHISDGRGIWGVLRTSLKLQPADGHRLYAKVRPKLRDRFVCRADRSETIGVFVGQGGLEA